jgi:hypothetical protein
MAHVVQHNVIAQHFKVVRRRTADFHNRFRFMSGDNGLERALHVGKLYEPFELQDLLEHALYLLTQCGLVDLNDNGLFSITEKGLKRLAVYQPPLSAEKIDELIAQDAGADDEDDFEEQEEDSEVD